MDIYMASELSYSNGFQDGYKAKERELEKYRWHDLRKSPDDLPEFYKKVEVVYWDKETHEIDSDYRDFTCYGVANPFPQIKTPMNFWRKPFQYFDYNYEIIAWREIEPF